MSKKPSERAAAAESALVALLALALYLPFLAIQYDTNGVAEAAALEAGQMVNKNHMLYRPIGFLIYRGLQHFGYAGKSLLVLQTMNAVCGAIGIGLAYALFKFVTGEKAAAAVGSFWLATSFTYWIFSTDAAYITVAGMFALAAMVCIAYGQSLPSIAAAGVLTSLSILTWQASVFLIPAILALMVAPGKWRPLRRMGVFILAVGVPAGAVYIVSAFALHGMMGPRAFWTWLTSYSEGGTLPLWGIWNTERIGTASVSAVRSIVPLLLAVRPTEITRSMQLGRVAVDFALLSLVLVIILAGLKIRLKSIWFLLGYALFIPFIVWWDPFEPKWFLIPNIFFAGFLSCGLQPWLHRKRMGSIVVLCTLTIAGANFVTTIRPRHKNLGPARSIAQCVADHLQTGDGFVAAEWGWPDYLNYVHSRTAINLINETAYAGTKERMLPAVREFIAAIQRNGGSVYMEDPLAHSESHLAWLNAQTGLTFHELQAFGGVPAFECSGRTVDKLP
jgi:hypothetical protein